MGNEIKTRNPQWLYHSDYLTFGQGVKGWCASQVGEPDYPTHLVPDFETKFDAFATAWARWDDLSQEQKGKNAIYTNTATAMAKHLQLLKDVFPTTIDDPPVLAEFGLDRPVPDDRDDVYTMAKTCVDQWNFVIGGGVPLDYAPLEPDFNVLLSLFAAFSTAKAEYLTTFNDAQQAQNAVLTTREACHDAERKIFNWYRARHKDPNDEWWTGTWWGTSSGEEPPAPVWPDWPGPVEASAEQIDEGLVRLTYSGLNGGKTLRIDRLKQGDADYVLVTQGLPLDDPEEVMPFDDNHLDKKKYTYKLTPFDEVGNPGMPALVEVTVS